MGHLLLNVLSIKAWSIVYVINVIFFKLNVLSAPDLKFYILYTCPPASSKCPKNTFQEASVQNLSGEEKSSEEVSHEESIKPLIETHNPT